MQQFIAAPQQSASAAGRYNPPMPRRLASALLAPLLLAHPVLAHQGAVVAKAEMCNPPGPLQTPTDGGIDYHYEPAYVPEEADQHYRFSWVDGDQDPTGRFTFFYVDHQLPAAVPPDAVDGQNGQTPIGKIIRTTGGKEARDIYVSCACAQRDAATGPCDGGTVPDCSDGGARWCDDTLDWDTSAVPPGVYWIAAVNNDPPYHVFNMSEAPVRVTHGGHKPPVVQVVRPDGLGGGVDQSYRVVAIVAGTGALTMDVAYGINLPSDVLKPVTVVARKVPIQPAPDGTVTWDFDVSKLPNNPYFVEITVTDDTGASTYSDSRYYLSVFHRAPPADLAAPRDLAAAPSDLGLTTQPGSCAAAGPTRAPTRTVATALAALAFALVLARRARR